MATRTYCDHCGNTITGSVNRFSFGPSMHFVAHAVPSYLGQQQNLNPYLYGTGGGGSGVYTTCNSGAGLGSSGVVGMAMVTMTANAPSKPAIQVETIDLCDNCVKIWMNRVRALCQASDPKPQENV